MNPTSSLSSAFLRRMARTPLRRRVVMPVRALSTTAPAPAPKGSLKKLNRPSLTQEPYSSTSLAALLARLTLPSTPELQQTVLACLTHPSFSAFQAADPEGTSADGQANNELLAALGNSLLGLFAAEEISIRYPHLPASALQSAVTTFVGPNALADVARELGLRVSAPTLAKPITAHANSPEAIPIRWKRTFMVNMVTREEKKESDIRRRREGFQEGLASVVRAFIGMIYQEQGMHAAREFVHAHFLSRQVDFTRLFNFVKPKFVLSNVVSKHLADAGVPLTPESSRIESRVLASSGAQTQAPLFNIGLFLSNGLKLAEGHGSSLRMAEHRAAENALFSLFLVKNADSSVTLPTAIHAERPYAAGAKAVTEPAAVEKQFVPHSAAAGTESLHGLSPRRNAAI